jgi:hypothetical protein
MTNLVKVLSELEAARRDLTGAESRLSRAYDETDALLADDIHEARYAVEQAADLVWHIVRKTRENFYNEVGGDIS